MEKNWILTADIHIYDYKQYNLPDYKRLDKFVDLAHRYVEIGKEQKADTLVIAGDLLHKAVSTPRVLNTINKFMAIVCDGFSSVYFITGNHDRFSKSKTSDIMDSAFPILSNGAKYVNGVEKTINGNRIGFLDWTPEIKWDTFEGKLDLLISHVTISSMFGQEIDESKFKLMLAGDIHNCSSIDNAHTINVPIPHYISDEQDGSVVVLNPNTLKWKRVETASESFQYLRMFYEDAVPIRHRDNPLVQRIQRAVLKTGLNSIRTSIDVDKAIKDAVTANSLQDIHNEISPNVNRDIELVSFQFQLIDIDILNFRSIDKLKFDFSAGLTLLSGLNGSGKSSVLRAIDYVLAGNGTPRSLMRKGEKEMSVIIRLSIGDRIHKISRAWNGSGSLEYWIDEEEVNASTMTERNAIIRENMPFLEYFNVLNRSQACPRFLSQYTFNGRIKLMQDILGLNLIERHLIASSAAINVRKEVIDEKEEQVNNLKAIIEDTDTDSFHTEIDDPEDLKEILKDLEDIHKEKTAENKLFNSRTALVLSRDQYREEMDGLSLSSDGDKLDIGKLKLDKSSMVRERDTKNEHNKLVAGNKAELELHKRNLSREIGELTNNVIDHNCPTCLQEINESIRDRLNHEVSATLDTKDTEFKSILSKLKDLPDEVDTTSLTKSIEAYVEKIAELESAEKSYKRYGEIKNTLVNIDNELTEYSEGLVETTEKYFEGLNSQIKDAAVRMSENNELIKTEARFQKNCDEMQSVSAEIDELKYALELYLNYYTLFMPNGLVVQSVFTEISELMTDETLKVRTVKTLASGQAAIDFDVDFTVGKLTLPYDELSGGQASIADIMFIMRLFEMAGGAGMMILDETLKEMDEDNLDIISKVLVEAPINTVLMSTHVASYPWYSQKLNCELVDNISHFHIEGQ